MYLGICYDLDAATLRLTAKRLARSMRAIWLLLPAQPEAGQGDLDRVFRLPLPAGNVDALLRLRYFANAIVFCLRGTAGSCVEPHGFAHLTHVAVNAIEVIRHG